jgi:hypothetical protein
MSVTAITANSKTMRLIAPAAASLAVTAVAVLCPNAAIRFMSVASSFCLVRIHALFLFL